MQTATHPIADRPRSATPPLAPGHAQAPLPSLHESFSVRVPVHIRPCEAGDLPALEWFGLFAGHRELILQMFRRHQLGEALMLVAEAGGEASGQAWIEFGAPGSTVAEIWAVRVLPCLQGQGIGARMMLLAEDWLAARGFTRIELQVEIGEQRARRFYERLGYACTGSQPARWQPLLGEDEPRQQWLMAKELAPRAGRTQ